MEDIEAKTKEILFEKLKEMAKANPNRLDPRDYVYVCDAMNDIAKTLLDR